MSRWKDYLFEPPNYVNENEDKENVENEQQREVMENRTLNINTGGDIFNSIKEAKSCKVLRANGIPADFLKPRHSAEILLQLFQPIWVEGKMPKDWKEDFLSGLF